MNKLSVRMRIDAAILDWELQYGTKPDIVYLGLREAMVLDRELDRMVTRYQDCDVLYNGQSYGISLARRYG